MPYRATSGHLYLRFWVRRRVRVRKNGRQRSFHLHCSRGEDGPKGHSKPATGRLTEVPLAVVKSQTPGWGRREWRPLAQGREGCNLQRTVTSTSVTNMADGTWARLICTPHTFTSFLLPITVASLLPPASLHSSALASASSIPHRGGPTDH